MSDESFLNRKFGVQFINLRVVHVQRPCWSPGSHGWHFPDHRLARGHRQSTYDNAANVLASNLVLACSRTFSHLGANNEREVPINFGVFTQVHHRASDCIPVHSHSLRKFAICQRRQIKLNLGL